MLIIIALGVYDDIHPLSAKIKFPIQLIALQSLFFRNQIKFITISISDVRYVSVGNTLSIILSIVWIAGITNAINLIDGLDGLSARFRNCVHFTFLCFGHDGRMSIIFSVLYIALAGPYWVSCPLTLILPRSLWFHECLFSGLHALGYIHRRCHEAYTALTMVVSLIALGCL